MRLWPLLLCLAACAGAPTAAPEGERLLAEAEQALADGDVQAAKDLLLDREEDDFPPAQQARFATLAARTQLMLGDPWEAFVLLRDFADRHPHSELRPMAIALEFEAGQRLAQSDRGFWVFWSDKRGARTCLEHLTTRYPNCEQFASAMRILGELALEQLDYGLAEERFRELLRRYPESEWAPLARFRFAMCIFRSLRGPDYDLDRMESAARELAVYLDSMPENPAFLEEAQRSFETLRQWRAERHWRIAAFYRRVDNVPGEIEHLHMANAQEFAATEAAARAQDRLRELGDPSPPSALSSVPPAQRGRP